MVLLDLTMPKLSGEATLRAIRRVNASMPVILMSGYSTDELTWRTSALKPSGFLEKPFNKQQLYAAVAKCFSQPIS